LNKVIIMFPYSGYDNNTQPRKARGEMFCELIDTIRNHTEDIVDKKPVIILNRDTERRGQAKALLDSSLSQELDIQRVWSVDTCQMWLHGWGYLIDRDAPWTTCKRIGKNNTKKQIDRIVLLPGDIETASDRFFSRDLRLFASATKPKVVVGDFETGERLGAKEMIDIYGTYPLLANWFPEISKCVRDLPLERPRSEFINISLDVLSEILGYRKFAYEQTLNIIIRCWNFSRKTWKYEPQPVPLGPVKDDSEGRRYRECMDQIERSERLLKLLWREIHDPEEGVADIRFGDYRELSDRYEDLDRRSTDIRDTSRIIIRSFLNL